MIPVHRPSKAKTQRLNIRTTDEEKMLVEQAARALRLNSSQFVLQAAIRSAEEVLADRTRFVLPHDQWTLFSEMLDRPARDIPAVKAAAAKRSPFSAR